MHLLLTGATGLVGSAVLHSMLTTPAVTKITILSRRPVAQAEGQSKVHTIIHSDFTTYEPDVLAQIKDVKGVVWALGISSMAVDKPEYENITYTYPLAFARAIADTTSPTPVNFIYISGEGATTTPSLLTSHWQRIKGTTEAALLALSNEKQYANLRPLSCRPGGVDPTAHAEILPFLPARKGVLWVADKVLAGPLNVVYPSIMSPTRELGKALMELAMGEGGKVEGKGVSGEGRTVSNVALRRLGGL